MTEKTKRTEPLICSICELPIEPHPISGWAGGNNARPVTDGRCCDDCDNMVVIPLRIAMIYRKRGA